MVAKNYPSNLSPPAVPSTSDGEVRCESVHSTTEPSLGSPLGADFGQFLVDDDFDLLDVWTDMTHQPM